LSVKQWLLWKRANSFTGSGYLPGSLIHLLAPADHRKFNDQSRYFSTGKPYTETKDA